jgi:hypothetical protein
VGKDGRCVGLTTLPPLCADCLEILEPQPPGTPRACSGKALPLHSAVWDNRRKVLPTVQRHVSDVHNVVESVEHVQLSLKKQHYIRF